VTASFGLCGMDHVPSGEHQVAEQVLRIADAALYRRRSPAAIALPPRFSTGRLRASSGPFQRCCCRYGLHFRGL